jgi:hypothetical protein
MKINHESCIVINTKGKKQRINNQKSKYLTGTGSQRKIKSQHIEEILARSWTSCVAVGPKGPLPALQEQFLQNKKDKKNSILPSSGSLHLIPLLICLPQRQNYQLNRYIARISAKYSVYRPGVPTDGLQFVNCVYLILPPLL